MGRLLALILICFVSLSLIAGTVAHAAEPIGCLDGDVAAGLGHADGDRDQVPSDYDRAAPHHHGGCHGHQIGEPVDDGVPSRRSPRAALPLIPNAEDRVSASIDPAHRPPRA